MNIEEFKANGLIHGGARSSLFRVFIPEWPGSDSDSEQRFRFLCKATQLPPSVLGQVEVPYQSRRIKVMGDRQYANWTETIMNDEDFGVREAMERWHQNMNMHVENVTNNVTPEPITYKRDALVQQLSKDGSILKEYTFKGIFPTQIDSIPVDWEAIDQIELFDVEFSIDYWLPYADTGGAESSYFADTARNIGLAVTG
jgi:hypothetical protein